MTTTENKLRRAEEDLIRNRTLLEEIEQLSGVGGWEYDAATKQIIWTNGVYRIHGVTPETYDPNDFEKSLEFYPANDRQIIREALKNAIRSGIPFDLELNLIKATGELRWIRTSVRPEIKDGKVIRALGYMMDITDRKQTEETLRATHERLMRILEVDAVGVMFWDLSTGSLVDANITFLKMMGYSRADIEKGNLTWQKFTPPEFHKVSLEEIGKFSQTGRVGPYEKEYYCKDGTRKWLLFSGSSLGGNQCVEFCIDISDKKKVETALHESEERFRNELKKYNETLEERVHQRTEEVSLERKRLYDVLETLPVYVILLDKDYRVPFANKFFRERFGESHGKRCYEFLFNKTGECNGCETYRVMKTRAPHHWEWTGPDGRNYDIFDFPFFEADGSMMILEMGIDITEQKSAQNALVDQQENLQKLNEALLKSNKELESFAYITSHDLQEPLRMVASYTQLLAQKYQDQLDDDAKEYIHYAVDGAKRMYDLINGLLHYSRISRKGTTIIKTDLNKIMETVRANLALVIKEKNVVIETGNLPVIYADYSQMIQLFQNLVANGIKFSNSEPRITVTSKTEKSQYVILVKDNGIGIEPQYYDHIFEIFKRLNPRDQFEGTGIGLAICKRIVENHNGKIWVESEPGKGTCFCFTLQKYKTHS
jgi:PAS domain S-box-containing protein